MNVADIKAELDGLSVPYKANAKKSELQALLATANNKPTSKKSSAEGDAPAAASAPKKAV